ncbi:unnamed protein product [Schistocephalus solidus]|uniref:Uncharacterized protein n=1 Tax=Schistocephalus solidus TaxID=70667 RepID=A0A183SXL6_SCHSO|nr:unnamed protein product [Schistocephalus solidus]
MNGSNFPLDWTASRLRAREELLSYYQPSCRLGASPRGLRHSNEVRQKRVVSVQCIDCRRHSTGYSNVSRVADYQPLSAVFSSSTSTRDLNPYQNVPVPRRCFPVSTITYSDIADNMVIFTGVNFDVHFLGLLIRFSKSFLTLSTRRI